MKYKTQLIVNAADGNKINERLYKPYTLSNILTQSDIKKLRQQNIDVIGDGVIDIEKSHTVENILGKNVFGSVSSPILKQPKTFPKLKIEPKTEPKTEPPPEESKTLVIELYGAGQLYRKIQFDDKDCLREYDVKVEQRYNHKNPLAEIVDRFDDKTWYMLFWSEVIKDMQPIFREEDFLSCTHDESYAMECIGNYQMGAVGPRQNFKELYVHTPVKDYQHFVPLYDHYDSMRTEDEKFDFQRKMYEFVHDLCTIDRTIVFHPNKTLWDFVKIYDGKLYLDSMMDEMYRAVKVIEISDQKPEKILEREKAYVDSFPATKNTLFFKILSQVLEKQIKNDEYTDSETLFLVGEDLFTYTKWDETSAKMKLENIINIYPPNSFPPLDQKIFAVNLLVRVLPNGDKNKLSEKSWSELHNTISVNISDPTSVAFTIRGETILGRLFEYTPNNDNETVEILINYLIHNRKNPVNVELFANDIQLDRNMPLKNLVNRKIITKRPIHVVAHGKDKTKYEIHVVNNNTVSDIKKLLSTKFSINLMDFVSEGDDSKAIETRENLNLYSPEHWKKKQSEGKTFELHNETLFYPNVVILTENPQYPFDFTHVDIPLLRNMSTSKKNEIEGFVKDSKLIFYATGSSRKLSHNSVDDNPLITENIKKNIEVVVLHYREYGNEFERYDYSKDFIIEGSSVKVLEIVYKMQERKRILLDKTNAKSYAQMRELLAKYSQDYRRYVNLINQRKALAPDIEEQLVSFSSLN